MKQSQLKGVFINCVEAQDSIYESGKMAYDCLVGSGKYSLDYIEITKDNLTLSAGFDFYFFNYHFATMAWLDTAMLRKILPATVITMVLEVLPNDPFVFCSPKDFDIYCVLDPTMNIGEENVFAFPRPLENLSEVPRYEPREIPLIASFGLGTQGKGFEYFIDAVNREFDRAQVRINIPFAVYSDKDGSYAKRLARICKERAKDGIEVTVTHDYMTKPELIAWCSQNTINCFFYDRNVPGLAATTDQAIASGRPLLISKNNTFRHIQKFIKPFPYQTIRDAIDTTEEKVSQIQLEWSPAKFRERFERVLEKSGVRKNHGGSAETVTLRLKPRTFSDLAQPLRDKAAIRTRLRKLDRRIGLTAKLKGKPKPPRSLTETGEDEIVFEVLDRCSIQNIRYLEVGADNSSTLLFYELGCQGVLIENDLALCHRLRTERSRDKSLNLNATDLDKLISSYFTECPDLVSMNTGKMVVDTLRTLNFQLWNPAVFCIRKAAVGESVKDMLEANGYFLYRDTLSHAIYVNKNLHNFCDYQRSHGV